MAATLAAWHPQLMGSSELKYYMSLTLNFAMEFTIGRPKAGHFYETTVHTHRVEKALPNMHTHFFRTELQLQKA